MADNKYCKTLFLGEPHDTHGTLPHLAYAARRGVYICVRYRLDRVDDDDLRRQFFNAGDNAVHIRLGQDIDFRVVHAQSDRPELELPLTLLTGDIEDPAPAVHKAAHLQQQCGFSYSRRAAHQHQGADDRASAQHPVKLSYAC